MVTDTVRVGVIGAGPRATMLIERIVANHRESGRGPELEITLVDPHPPGAGRIWRGDQSPLLKLNSMARDVTVFTDESCIIEGPVRDGPSLHDWVRLLRDGLLPDIRIADDRVRAEIAGLRGEDFPTRRLNSHYLGWFYSTLVRDSPASVRISWRRASARSVSASPDGTHRIQLDDGVLDDGVLDDGVLDDGVLDADIIVYALGHNARMPGPRELALQRFAARNGLLYIAPDFTADAELGGVSAGEDVIVRGMGLAAVDLIVLLFEGRGGRFVRDETGRLGYRASGAEPRVHIGSRRGVPYRSKVASTLRGDAPRLEVLTPEVLALLGARTGDLDYKRELWPLIATELLLGHYRELFTGYPERVRGSWLDVAHRIRTLAWDSAELLALIAESVPDPDDRFDVQSFDRPLGTERFASVEDAQRRVRAHIRQDLALRTDPEHSASLGLFFSALLAYLALAEIPEASWNARSRALSLPRDWHTFFSYLASGPPAHRLEELLALSEAGLVRFLGPDVTVQCQEGGGFIAASPSVPGTVASRVLIDAWLPESQARESMNPVLRDLIASGVGAELALGDAEFSGTTGKVAVHAASSRLLDARGLEHPTLFAVGNFTTAIEAGAFTRPRANGLPFRQNDATARALLDQAAVLASGRQRRLVSAAPE